MDKIYIISKYVTVVGSVLKGFWEHLFCRMLAIPVQDARYLQANELCGHVEHDFTKTKLKTFLLCYLPGLMNRLFGYGMTIGSFIGLYFLKVPSSSPIFWIDVLLLYLGVSLFCNNAPLFEDALNNWDLLYGKNSETKTVVKVFAFIPSAYILASAWLEKNAISFAAFIVAIIVGIVL